MSEAFPLGVRPWGRGPGSEQAYGTPRGPAWISAPPFSPRPRLLSQRQPLTSHQSTHEVPALLRWPLAAYVGTGTMSLTST